MVDRASSAELMDELPFAASRALVIGIDHYDHAIPRLRTARADALELRRLLQTEHGFQVDSLINQVTAARIRRALARLTAQTGADDRVLFYFAGHGFAYDVNDRPSGFLLPSDARAGELATYLPMEEVYRSLDALPCSHVLTILDCCFAGAFRWAGTRDLAAPPRKVYREQQLRCSHEPVRRDAIEDCVRGATQAGEQCGCKG